MQQYLGAKLIQAEPLTLGDYNQRRGWTIPENENPNREGYYIVYPDGYVSWSPKEVFDEAYRRTDGLSFGLAIEALKKGKLVARAGWNGKGMFIFIRPSDELSVDFIIEKVKSLPDALKKYYVGQFAHTIEEKEKGKSPSDVAVKFGAYFCMKAADNSIVNGWLASQTDMLAEDWEIIE